MKIRKFSAKRPAQQRGITLVEAALVVSIVSLIILAALLALNTVTEQRRVTQATNDVANIRSAVSKWAAGGLLYYGNVVLTGTATTPSSQNLANFDQIAYFLPDPLRAKAGSNPTLEAANPWQGNYIYVPANSTLPRRWKLTITEVPETLTDALDKQLTANGATDVTTSTTNVEITYDE